MDSPTDTQTGTSSSQAMAHLSGKVIFEIRPPKELEHSAADFSRCLLALSQLKKSSFLERFQGIHENLSLEIAVMNSQIHFYATVPERMATYFESQIASSYPAAKVVRLEKDYLLDAKLINPQVKELVLSYASYFPLRTYKDDRDTDALSAVLGALSKAQPDEIIVFQINLAHGGNWQGIGRQVLQRGVPDVPGPDGKMRYKSHPNAKLIEAKISQKGFEVSMRIMADSPEPSRSVNNLHNISGAFGSLALGEGNSLSIGKDSMFFKANHLSAFYKRSLAPHAKYQFLNVDEIATLYHLPDENTSQIKNIAWGGETFNDPPVNLPVPIDLTDEDKQKINFFAKTEFKNQMTTFGIKDGEDRRRHFYIIGKTGTGKSTLIANMAISDIRKGHGVAVIDPHGDLSEILLNYIPANRINDVAYLDPSNPERSFHLNPFEITGSEQSDIVTSNFVSIFYKLYSYSWGPRLEYILRNTVHTLVQKPNSTMLDIPRLLTDDRFRKTVVNNINDPVLRNFWLSEYNEYAQTFRQEAISPILNKVGQFLSSPKIRNIVGHEKSTVNLHEIMNEGKVLILNLSQGRLGEDNAALLGALFITKFQLAAASRAGLPEADRRDFFLYVDEFQNFATTSFIKILSEARKYRLNLILANQYMAQLLEEVQKAIFGNVGSIVTFTVGSPDATILFKEFGKTIPEEDFVRLAKYQIALKLSIDAATSAPFLGTTLPLLSAINQNREKILRSSEERYTKPVEAIPEQPVVDQSYQAQAPQTPPMPQAQTPMQARPNQPPGQNFKPPPFPGRPVQQPNRPQPPKQNPSGQPPKPGVNPQPPDSRRTSPFNQ